VGAAGVACTKINHGSRRAEHHRLRSDGRAVSGPPGKHDWMKDWYARNTNPNEQAGTIHEIIKGADVFMGLSVPGVIDARKM
jgi:malate dehydrogenase (oxaloacetate-decarboxylating)